MPCCGPGWQLTWSVQVTGAAPHSGKGQGQSCYNHATGPVLINAFNFIKAYFEIYNFVRFMDVFPKCISLYHMHALTLEAKEGVSPPGTEVTNS